MENCLEYIILYAYRIFNNKWDMHESLQYCKFVKINLRDANKVKFSGMINAHNLSSWHFQINVKSLAIQLSIMKFGSSCNIFK